MEAVGKLAGGVAHDFNNLLTAIGGYAELLVGQLPPDAPASEDAREILLASDRAASLTRQLLAYSRKQMLSPEVLDLRAVVDNLGGMLRRLIGEDVGFVVLQAPGPMAARVDRGQFEQVVVNLVVNARDSMPNGGTLTVATAAVDLDEAFARPHLEVSPGPHICLTVQDTGCGMDEPTRSHLRPVLHHQGTGQRHRVGAVDGLRHRAAERRERVAGERGGGRHHSAGLPPAAERTAGGCAVPGRGIDRPHAGRDGAGSGG